MSNYSSFSNMNFKQNVAVDVDDDNDDDDDHDDEEVGMSQHLFEQLSSFVDPEMDVSTKIQKAKNISKYVEELDGYMNFSCENTQKNNLMPTEGQLPALEWHAHFRKAYTLLLWVRPVLGGEKFTTIMEDDAGPTARRVLYRFATTANDDANGLGVCVTVGDWRVLVDDSNDDDGNDEKTDEGDNDDASAANRHQPRKNRIIQTTLTAYALPNAAASPLAAMSNEEFDDAAPYVTAPLELVENEWSLLGITHVYPYLKRPHWSVCVNGSMVANGELKYPVLDRTPIMQFNTLFQNLLQGGAIVHNAAADVKKTASELQTMVYPRLKLNLHLASFCLCKEALPTTMQALLAHAGPALALQQHGALPTLPPIANWSKGSSLEGPNVGIPLIVHGQALQLQQVASSAVLWGSAVMARMLGANHPGSNGSIQRVIVRMPHKLGTTEGVHRVGLIQPTAPDSHPHLTRRGITDDSENDNSIVSLSIIGGGCSVHHNLSAYLLHSPDVANVDTQLFHATKHFSLLLEGQAMDSQIVLPFFLALPPPATLLDLQNELYQNSAKHLYSLYQNDGAFATQLLQLLSASIISGGGRHHEQLLQNGTIHVLTTCLRQSLVRAEVLEVYNCSSLADFIAYYNSPKGKSLAYSSMASLPTTPKRIPPSIVSASIQLISACCGPPALFLEDLAPAQQIQRTSDIALTALFGFALELEVWGKDLIACQDVLEAIASRYGGSCVTAGYIVRSQISVQYLLDLFKSKLDRLPYSKELERISNAGAQILQAMLLSSLTNRRSISQGEHDISACMGALSDCPLGSVGGHVIFTALMGVLQWCEIFPPSPENKRAENDNFLQSNSNSTRIDEDHKLHVSARLCRNLLMGQFHDVVAPMLLSRTVFCGERSMGVGSNSDEATATSTASASSSSSANGDRKGNSAKDGTLSWQNHWRLGLQIFSWIASIAGPDGFIASRSLGSLLLASGLAGSLKGALDEADHSLVSTLFLPPPAMALTIAATTRRNEWSYTDLLSDRLEVMMPLLPGLVVSVLSHPSDVMPDTMYSKDSLDVLSELLTAVGGAFYRVFGGMTHSAASSKRSNVSSLRMAVSGAVKAAKDFVPHLLIVAMILENHIDVRRAGCPPSEQNGIDEDPVQVLGPPTIQLPSKRAEGDASWLEVSSTVNESFLSDGAVEIPEHTPGSETVEALISRLLACQTSIMTTISELLINAMRAGGGEASTLMWRSVLSTLKESVAYAARDAKDESVGTGASSQTGYAPNSETQSDSRQTHAESMAHNVLCRLAANVLIKSLRRDSQWEVWSPSLSSAVSRLCLLAEEKELLLKPLGRPLAHKPDEQQPCYTNDQILLFSALLNVLSYGRDTTGWCQLILPRPPPVTPKTLDAKKTEDSKNKGEFLFSDNGTIAGSLSSTDDSPPPDAAPAASKLMLPVLQPCVRVILECIVNLPSSKQFILPPAVSSSQNSKGGDVESSSATGKQGESILKYAMLELQESLTAAIVGMSFPSARDVALQAMASLRRAMTRLQNAGDEAGAVLCTKLLCDVAEEIRVRYEGERRRRETALFDAYDDEADEPERSARAAAAADAREIENLILGGDLIPPKDGLSNVDDRGGRVVTEEVTFHADDHDSGTDKPKPGGSDDFVLFHESYSDGNGRTPDNKSKMQWSRYEGFGSALEECIVASSAEVDEKKGSRVDTVLKILTPYLDAWDEIAAAEAAESELVSLFDFGISPALNVRDPKGQETDDSLQQLPILGSETAADSMSTFIEFAAVEKSRLAEVINNFLPSHRHSCVAFAERFCWARYKEIARDSGDMSELWERGIADGNRDIRSRLVTIPCNPQFKRYIPRYLDHSANVADDSKSGAQKSSGTSSGAEAEDETSLDKRLSGDLMPSSKKSENFDMLNTSMAATDMGHFTKALVETAHHLEIVDITKKEIVEDEDAPDLLLPSASSIDDDEMFSDDVPLEMPSSTQPSEEPRKTETKPVASEVDSTTDATMTTDDTTQQETVDTQELEKIKIGSSHFNIASSAFASPPDNSSSTLSLIHSAAAGMIEQHLENCLHVKAEGSRKCSMFLTATHLILEYDADADGLYEGELMAVKEEAERQKLIMDAGGPGSGSIEDDDRIQEILERRQREAASLRPKSIRWNLSELSHVYLRRYRLRDSALEMFFIPSGGTSFGGYGLYSPSTSLFLDFGPGYEGNTRRDDAGFAIMKRAPPQAIKQWPDRFSQFLHEQLSRLTIGWVEGRITNFDYLLHLNMLAGRSYNDICQ